MVCLTKYRVVQEKRKLKNGDYNFSDSRLTIDELI